MIQHSLGEAYRLIGRSRKEASIYILSCFLCGAVYVFLCGALGLGDAYLDDFGAMKSALVKWVIAYLPGFAISAWFSAGLVGRFTMDAFNGAPEGMTHYAKGWYTRSLGGEAIITTLLFLTGLVHVKEYPATSFFALAWFIAVLLFALRASLWLNVSFVEGTGLFDSIKRSCALSEGMVPKLLTIVAVPFVLTLPLGWLAGELLPGHTAALFLVREGIRGCAEVVVMGALAAAYLKLKSGRSAAAEPEVVKAES